MIGLATPALAQRDATVPDPDPEVERKTFQVADGFEVNLFAGDPMLAKPIQMNFDAAGRLWVASSEVYPQIAPGQTANDKILVLEDKDGDGKADTTTVFADGLLIPTGVAPGDGGAYVANSTELLFLKDTDGDGKADSRTVMLSGFGTEDTHHIIHTFRWSPDGQLYFNQSTYIHSHVETPWGPRRLGGGGIWMFRPESRKLEIFTRGLINPWGHQVDAWGQNFATDGAGGEGINYMIPGASYAWTPGESRIVAGLNPGSPKYCGLEIVSGRHMPDDMQGVLVTNDFRAHRVCRFQLSDDGSGFASKELPELIKSTHPAFRPIDVALGPDGAIYIADWYNPIIQHGEVDFRDPRRDHTHGRIWRVTAKGRATIPNPRIPDLKVSELLDSLKSPEGWTRRMANRVLKEKGKDAVEPALHEWVKGLDKSDPNVEHHKLEALWVYQGLDVPDLGMLVELMASPDPRVRAAALRVVPFWKGRIDEAWIFDNVIARASDDSPRVRLEAVRALASFGDVKAFEGAMTAFDKPRDKFLDYALWLTVRAISDAWMPEFRAGKLALIEDAAKLTFALQAVGTSDVVETLIEMLSDGKVADSSVGSVRRVIGERATPEELGRMINLALKGGNRDRASALRDLLATSEPRGIKPAGDLSGLIECTQADDHFLQSSAIRAVGAWRVEAGRNRLEEIARHGERTARSSAVEALGLMGGTASRELIESVCRDPDEVIAYYATCALAAVDPDRAAPHVVRALGFDIGLHWNELRGLIYPYTDRAEGAGVLIDALNATQMRPSAARRAISVARGAAKPSPELIKALMKAGGIKPPPPLPTPEEMSALIEEVRAKGQPKYGEDIFRNPELQCLKCHAIAGAGGNVGPGLESIGASAQVDYLIDSLLQPTKAVKEGYHSIVIATKDGRIVTGIVQRRDDRQVVLRDAEGAEVVVAIENIEEEKPGQSLMPEALVAELPRDEFVHLVRFLSELGKPGEFAVGPEQVVRRWEYLPATQEMAQSVKRIGHAATARGEQPRDAAPIVWQSAYSKVNGELPLDDTPPLPDLDASDGRHWLRFGVDVTTAGKLRFELNSIDGVTAWVDGNQVELSTNMRDFLVEMSVGSHAITLAIDPEARRSERLGGPDNTVVRCWLVDIPDSPARARVRTGR